MNKYPRTYHLPWSPGATADDKIQHDLSYFIENPSIAILEKRDGENTTMTRDVIHARSLDSKSHPSRDWVKALWAQVRWNIPEGWRVCGENLYARHSIAYDDLESYFEVFSIWDEEGWIVDWETTQSLCKEWGLSTVPTLFTTMFNEYMLQTFHESSAYAWRPFDREAMEGYVIRPLYSFDSKDFERAVLKWVRPNHVTTDEHWMHSTVVPNGLRK